MIFVFENEFQFLLEGKLFVYHSVILIFIKGDGNAKSRGVNVRPRLPYVFVELVHRGDVDSCLFCIFIKGFSFHNLKPSFHVLFFVFCDEHFAVKVWILFKVI